jgi:hypothetical protein
MTLSTATSTTATSTTSQRQPRSTALLLVAGVALSILAGCASTPAGVAGYDAFKADTMPKALIGSRDAALAAQCFEDQAKFLPLSTFSRDPATTAFTYRLRVSDLWFEEVRITPEGVGSRAEWRVASNLDAKWLGQFERDRVEPLRQCLGA